ncbi:MAG: translation initiation factor IF-3 [Thermoguttaceae bacterium]|nr:translation initiation factor IF-3 [Thermoguttaceae bacterium]MBR6480738.1 translation initiation factor IF-3 [Thermoguttaceae bacterium]
MENRNKNVQRINEMIRVSQVRVISNEGEQLGVMPTSEALIMAHEADLDLVEVAPDAKPPVCKIMNYGKFKYQQRKKDSKQQAPKGRLKELRMRPKTGEADIMVKVNKGREFLTKKDKVLVSINFRGREAAHIDEGMKLMQFVIEQLADVSKVEAPAKQLGKKITCTLAPK